MRHALLAAVLLVAATAARAEVISREIEYAQGDTKLQGFLAWDDAAKGKRPGVLVVHEWWGHNQHARNQALRLAKDGFVGFALDMYGKGKVATHPTDAQAFVAEATKDIEVLKARFMAALELLKQQPQVDADELAAIGYCFGGGVVLGMVRAGIDLDAVATFHGMVSTETPAAPGKIKARVIVLTGADDPLVTAEQIDAFRKEMTDAGVEFEIVSYPGAKHSFTNPGADKTGMPALAYNAEADAKSWAKMLETFREVFGK